ncbi:MAG: hypothetical protein K5884_05900 [Ruminococcus sp.]|nr:hypothetical protein [Ruminococcus sp.]
MKKIKKFLYSPVFDLVFSLYLVYTCRGYINYAGVHCDDYSVRSGIAAGISCLLLLVSFPTFIIYLGKYIFSKTNNDKE